MTLQGCCHQTKKPRKLILGAQSPTALNYLKTYELFKIPVVARVIASDFGARPILGELLYVLQNTLHTVPGKSEKLK